MRIGLPCKHCPNNPHWSTVVRAAMSFGPLALAMYVPTEIKERAIDYNPDSVFPNVSDVVELQFKVTMRLPHGTRVRVRVESIHVRASARNPIGNTALMEVVGHTPHDTTALVALRTYFERVPLPPGCEQAVGVDDSTPPSIGASKFPFPNSTRFRRLGYQALDTYSRQYRFYSPS